MKKRHDSPRHGTATLRRIERKCDRILSELLMIRRRDARQSDNLDAAIERMHATARKLKAQSEHERDESLRMLISKLTS